MSRIRVRLKVGFFVGFSWQIGWIRHSEGEEWGREGSEDQEKDRTWFGMLPACPVERHSYAIYDSIPW